MAHSVNLACVCKLWRVIFVLKTIIAKGKSKLARNLGKLTCDKNLKKSLKETIIGRGLSRTRLFVVDATSLIRSCLKCVMVFLQLLFRTRSYSKLFVQLRYRPWVAVKCVAHNIAARQLLQVPRPINCGKSCWSKLYALLLQTHLECVMYYE